jgi:hypothetical protein
MSLIEGRQLANVVAPFSLCVYLGDGATRNDTREFVCDQEEVV